MPDRTIAKVTGITLFHPPDIPFEMVYTVSRLRLNPLIREVVREYI
ncbi:MAG TPA: hypothetical protein VNM22_14820 [Candidatus Limnocylindrales bacterium]|nr:hypothetical protein [Candidatus Limnocylindrales bacterium]